LVERTAQPAGLGRGFWAYTAILTLVAIVSIVFWYVFPLERYLPAAIVTARQVDTLFRFMAATGTWSISRSSSAPKPPTPPMRSGYKSTITASSSFGGR
jgi:hypothetical protein